MDEYGLKKGRVVAPGQPNRWPLPYEGRGTLTGGRRLKEATGGAWEAMFVTFDEQAFLREGPGAEVRVGLSVAGIDLFETPEYGPMWWDDPIAFVIGLRYALDASWRFGYFDFGFLETDGTVHFLTIGEDTSIYFDLSGRCASIRTDLLLRALQAAEERLRVLVRGHYPNYPAELPDTEARFMSAWLAGRADYAVYQSPRTPPDRVLEKLEHPEAVES